MVSGLRGKLGVGVVEKKNKKEREMKREKKERKGCRLYAGARDIWVHVG